MTNYLKTPGMFFLAAILSAQIGVAQDRDRSNSNAGNNSGAVSAPEVQNSGYQNAAQGASDSQGQGQQTGMMVGGMLMSVGAAKVAASRGTDPTGYAMIAAGGLSAIWAGTSGGDSGANQGLADQFNTGGPAQTTPENTQAILNDANITKGLAEAKKAGVTVDFSKKTITTPDGKTKSFEELSSAAAISKMSAADQATLKKEIVNITKKAKSLLSGSDSFGDQIAGGSGEKSAETGDGGEANLFATGGLNRDPAQVAGLSTTYNGEPIGVASDSIFGIVDRRYEFHEKKGSFLSGSKNGDKGGATH